jgi:uncharacterized protein YjiS (DUF1127 family)
MRTRRLWILPNIAIFYINSHRISHPADEDFSGDRSKESQMNRDFSHEYAPRHFVNTAHADRAEAIARFGFLVIAGADRGLRRSFEALEAGFTGLARQWTDYRARRATYLALTKLDDRLLRDIGLTRADVELRPGELPEPFAESAPAPSVRAAVVSHDFKRAA